MEGRYSLLVYILIHINFCINNKFNCKSQQHSDIDTEIKKNGLYLRVHQGIFSFYTENMIQSILVYDSYNISALVSLHIKNPKAWSVDDIQRKENHFCSLNSLETTLLFFHVSHLLNKCRLRRKMLLLKTLQTSHFYVLCLM